MKPTMRTLNQRTDQTPSAKLSRRRFVGGGLAITGVSMFSSLLTMQQFANEAAAQHGGDDYKALVCVFLFGGNDSFNTLIPTHPGEYQTYSEARQSLAIAKDTTLPLSVAPDSPNLVQGTSRDTRSFALHPAMAGLQGLFDTRVGSFVANVGMLYEPLTKREYLQALDGMGAKTIPMALYSHRDQRRQWRNANPTTDVPDGWAGRIPPYPTETSPPPLPVQISLSGNNGWQKSTQDGAYVISANGSRSLAGDDSSNGQSIERIRFEAQVGGKLTGMPPDLTFDAVNHSNRLKRAYNSSVRETTDLHQAFSANFSAALTTVQAASVDDPMTDNSFEQDLQAVAASIVAGEAAGLRRQVFFVELRTFDHHTNQLQRHDAILTQLSDGLTKFSQTLDQVEVHDSVVTFTASEFGRSLKPNQSGTDHAWGGHQWVMGGPVIGGKILGEYPEDLTLGGAHDVETNGRILPTTSVDEFGGELATWFGVSDDDLPTVFPNISNFYEPLQERHPVGLFQPRTPWVATSSCRSDGGVLQIAVKNETSSAGEFTVWFNPPLISDPPITVSLWLELGETRATHATGLGSGRWLVAVAAGDTTSKNKIFSQNVRVSCSL